MRSPSEGALEGRAPGKVVLFGEYVVLEGAPAIALASNRSARARLLERWGEPSPFERRYELSAPGLGEGAWRGALSEADSLEERLESAAQGEKRGVDFQFAWAALCVSGAPSGRYEVDTSAFGCWQGEGEGRAWLKLGLGSSAASVVALLRLSAALEGCERTPEALYETAQAIHHHAQGSLGSGVDVAVSAWGGVLRYRLPLQASPQTSPQVTPLTLSPEVSALPSFAWVWMGASASTPQLVRQVRVAQARDPVGWAEVSALISGAEAHAAAALEAQAKGEHTTQDPLTALHEAVARGGEATRALSAWSGAPVWSEAHSALEGLVRPLGAHIKPTGAGGGDLALLSVADAEALPALKAHLQASGWALITL
jgi:phosphomevalonate kinase